VDSTNNRVGVGTTTPDNKLEISDLTSTNPTLLKLTCETAASPGESNTAIQLSGTSGGGYGGYIEGYLEQGVGSGLKLGHINSSQVKTEHMRIIANGNVGIGTTTPNFPLTIQETTTNTNTVTYPLALRAISSGTVDDGFGVGLRFQCERRDTDDFASLAGSVEVYGTNIPGTEDLWNMRFGVRNNDTAVTPMTLQYDGKVGIGATNPQTNLHIESSGDTGLDIYGGDTNSPYIFIGEHVSSYSRKWGMKMNYYGNSNTEWFNMAVVDDNTEINALTFRRNGNVGIGTQSPDYNLEVNGSFSASGPTTGANHGSSSTLYLLDTPIIKEWQWTGATNNTLRVTFTTSELPTNCKAIYADVFMPTSSNDDHVGHALGKNVTQKTMWTGSRNRQPSLDFGNLAQQQIFLSMPGQNDGFEYYFGNWWNSCIVPLGTTNKLYHTVSGESTGTEGWIYMVIKGYFH
jgi:hypothetical protein